ncbi:MAG: PD-(D/E)XK nuclease family protein [Opitutales bacterium]
MPKRHFLTRPESLSQQAAAFLAVAEARGQLALTHSRLITPTAGAAREIGRQLQAAGRPIPGSSQPMRSLLPERDDIAGAVEQSMAWSEALKRASDSENRALFWKHPPGTLAERLKAARNLSKLCQLLAEAGKTPATFELPDPVKASFDEARWQAIAALHKNYLKQLQQWGLSDPDQLRLQQVASPTPGIRHLIIIGVPDLPTIYEAYCEALEAAGSTVDLLIWNPARADEHTFDDWGRPLPERWTARPIPIGAEQLFVAASARDEARVAIRQLLDSPSAGLVAADAKVQSVLAGEILARGKAPYLPEGASLIRTEAAQLALAWDEFRISTDLRTLRRLVQLPAFCRALDREAPIAQSDALTAIDHLLGETIADTLDAARAASPALAEHAPPRLRKTRGLIRRLLGAVHAQRKSSAFDLIEAAFPEDSRPESAERVLKIGRQLEGSPAIQQIGSNSGSIPSQIFTQAILAEPIQTAAPEGAIPLNGWLEAPWLDHGHLILCGLCEGQIPQTLDGDPFLPDSIRPALGLSHNDQRLARDSYLLSSLLASRPPDRIHLSFSKYNRDGDPNQPSRLLLRTAAEELPQRVKQTTRAQPAARSRAKRATRWKWQLPETIPDLPKISPTQFEAYLSCPFRFCLGKVLRLDRGPEASHEMNATVFGNLIHTTLEHFGREAMRAGEQMLRLGEQDIRQHVQRLLEAEALAQFGPAPAPAVRVQIANAATRLHAYARIQAACFAEGWIILDVERKLEAGAGDCLQIGPLQLSGVIDRIEQHAQTGALRVMDYKTFSTLKKPDDTHFRPAAHNWLPEGLIERPGGKTRAWKNLQLPLYRRILEHWYPEQTRAQTPETAYFVLPSDPNESGIYPFGTLNEAGVYESALSCAEAVAGQIHNRVYWPPQPFRSNWDDPIAALLVNGAAEDTIAPESIARLKGGRA